MRWPWREPTEPLLGIDLARLTDAELEEASEQMWSAARSAPSITSSRLFVSMATALQQALVRRQVHWASVLAPELDDIERGVLGDDGTGG